jgi:hypothetical protein
MLTPSQRGSPVRVRVGETQRLVRESPEQIPRLVHDRWTVVWTSALYPGAQRLAYFESKRAAELFAQRVRSDVRQHRSPEGGRLRQRRGAIGAPYHSHPTHPYRHPAARRHRRR